MKTIRLNKKILYHCNDIQSEKENTKKIIDCIFLDILNENNKNEYDKSINKLSDYRHLKRTVSCPEGRYIMFIDMTDLENVKLHAGGFVMYDTGYSITLKLYDDRVMKFNRKNKELFVKFTDQELIADLIK
jgi:hypothetical protein